MNKLKEILNSYFWLIIIAFAIFVTVIGCLIYQNWQDGATSRMADRQSIEANKAVREAAGANGAAISFDAARQTEDVRRANNIKPKLDAARSNSNNSKTQLERAKNKLNETNKNLGNFNADRADNCAELARLFPDTRFEYCLGR